jgi:hypothetical protein
MGEDGVGNTNTPLMREYGFDWFVTGKRSNDATIFDDSMVRGVIGFHIHIHDT